MGSGWTPYGTPPPGLRAPEVPALLHRGNKESVRCVIVGVWGGGRSCVPCSHGRVQLRWKRRLCEIGLCDYVQTKSSWRPLQTDSGTEEWIHEMSSHDTGSHAAARASACSLQSAEANLNCEQEHPRANDRSMGNRTKTIRSLRKCRHFWQSTESVAFVAAALAYSVSWTAMPTTSRHSWHSQYKQYDRSRMVTRQSRQQRKLMQQRLRRRPKSSAE